MPSRSQSQGQIQAHDHSSRQTRRRTRSPSPQKPSEPATSPPPLSKPRGKSFRIGGRAKKATPEPPQPEDNTIAHSEQAAQSSMPPFSQEGSQPSNSLTKPRKPFRIGGKHKVSEDTASSQHETSASTTTTRLQDAQSPTLGSSPPPMPQVEKEELPVTEVHDETPEEKAARKRAELKRRNQDIARKQAQHKKKKRF